MSRLIRRRDRGAIAALFAVLLASNSLLAMGALTVDVGLLYVEREQLQSGADAAAVAVAKVCAGNSPVCGPDPAKEIVTDTAARYAGANARDDVSKVVTVCGRVLQGGLGTPNRLSPCAEPGPGNLAGCIGNPPPSPVPYVEVHLGTELPDGSTALPPVFAGAVTGTDGTSVAACARASWLPVTKVTNSPAIVMPICNFRNATNVGTLFQPPPTGPGEHDVFEEAAEVLMPWQDPGDSGCRIISEGREIPDGFGWLTSGFPGCRGTIEVGKWYDGLRPRQTPDGCAEILVDAYATSTPITVGIFDDAHTPGHTDEYRIAGIAQFVVTGWHSPDGWDGGPDGDHEGAICECELWLTGRDKNVLNIYGYFTTGIVRSDVGSLGADLFGAVYVQTIG